MLRGLFITCYNRKLSFFLYNISFEQLVTNGKTWISKVPFVSLSII